VAMYTIFVLGSIVAAYIARHFWQIEPRRDYLVAGVLIGVAGGVGQASVYVLMGAIDNGFGFGLLMTLCITAISVAGFYLAKKSGQPGLSSWASSTLSSDWWW